MAHDLHDWLKLLLDYLKSGKAILFVWMLLFGTGAYTIIDLIPEDKPTEPEKVVSVKAPLPAPKQDPITFCRGLMKRHIKDLH